MHVHLRVHTDPVRQTCRLESRMRTVIETMYYPRVVIELPYSIGRLIVIIFGSYASGRACEERKKKANNKQTTEQITLLIHGRKDASRARVQRRRRGKEKLRKITCRVFVLA